MAGRTRLVAAFVISCGIPVSTVRPQGAFADVARAECGRLCRVEGVALHASVAPESRAGSFRW